MRYIIHQHCRRTLQILSTKLSPSTANSFWTLSKLRRINQAPLMTTTVHRFLATSRESSSNKVSDNIIRSPIPDIEIPTDIPFHDYMFRKCDLYGDLPAKQMIMTARKQLDARSMELRQLEYQTKKTYTYSQVKERAIKVASALHRLGFKKGDVFLCFSPNNINICLLVLACSCLGIWYSAANPSFTTDELMRQVTDCGCVGVFTIPSLAGTVKDALDKYSSHQVKRLFVFGEHPGFQPFHSLLDDDGMAFPDVDINPVEDVYLLPYSSGTTGLPKGVMLTHFNIIASCLQMWESSYVAIGTRMLCLLPLYHVYGMVIIQYCTLQCGGLLITLPKFEPETFLRCIQDTKIEFMHLVPAVISFLTKQPMVSNYDITSVRRVVSAASSLSEDLTKTFLQRHSHGINIVQGFGMTETTATNINTQYKFESVGTMAANTLGKIVDPDTNKILGPNELGEYCVKGPQIMKGYLNNQAATNSTITPDGWLHTGDLGYFTEDQTVHIKDRLKDLIKYKGNQVSPTELESILLGYSGIADVAVVGVPHEEAGEFPKAFVVKIPGSGVTEENLVKFVEGRTSPAKWLRGGVQFVDVIPRNLSGKILRRVIKEKYITGSSVRVV